LSNAQRLLKNLLCILNATPKYFSEEVYKEEREEAGSYHAEMDSSNAVIVNEKVKFTLFQQL
jgi:hypothetical protein